MLKAFSSNSDKLPFTSLHELCEAINEFANDSGVVIQSANWATNNRGCYEAVVIYEYRIELSMLNANCVVSGYEL